MVVGRAGQRPVVVVVPGNLTQPVVDAHDDVHAFGLHALEIGLAGMAGGAAVAPHRMGMEVPDHRQLGDGTQKPLDTLVRSGIVYDTLMPTSRRLVRERMLDDVHVLVPPPVPVPDEEAEGLA